MFLTTASVHMISFDQTFDSDKNLVSLSYKKNT